MKTNRIKPRNLFSRKRQTEVARVVFESKTKNKRNENEIPGGTPVEQREKQQSLTRTKRERNSSVVVVKNNSGLLLLVFSLFQLRSLPKKNEKKNDRSSGIVFAVFFGFGVMFILTRQDSQVKDLVMRGALSLTVLMFSKSNIVPHAHLHPRENIFQLILLIICKCFLSILIQ